jgi:hypothetical protein
MDSRRDFSGFLADIGLNEIGNSGQGYSQLGQISCKGYEYFIRRSVRHKTYMRRVVPAHTPHQYFTSLATRAGNLSATLGTLQKLFMKE